MTDANPRTELGIDAASVGAQHDVSSSFESYVAPTTSGDFNAIHAPLVAVACWRMNHVLFGFDSSFILPAVANELRTLAALVRSNPGSLASIFGHADPVGDDDYNKKLSGRRAQSLYALLVRNTDLWEALHQTGHGSDDWGTRSIQTILQCLVSSSGQQYYAGAIDGVAGTDTKGSVAAFQDDNGLTSDGIAGPLTRKQLFASYMDAICVGPGAPFQISPEGFVGGGQDQGAKGACQGCSAFNPIVVMSKATLNALSQSDTAERDARNAPNRRVMLFLYRPGSAPSSTTWPCPRVSEGTDGCKAQFWSDGDKRRRAGEADRDYAAVPNTMACRFYERFARLSPCEGTGSIPVPVRPDVYIDDDSETPGEQNLVLVATLPPDVNGITSVQLGDSSLQAGMEYFFSGGALYFAAPGTASSLEGRVVATASGRERRYRFRIARAQTVQETLLSLSTQIDNVIALAQASVQRAKTEQRTSDGRGGLAVTLVSQGFLQQVRLLNHVEAKLTSNEDLAYFYDHSRNLPTLLNRVPSTDANS